MIHELTSDLASFKTLRFHKGLNILLAEKSRGATDRQSRNGAGKTSFVELVHFLLGAQAPPRSIFRSPELRSAKFKLTVDLAGERIAISRSGAAPNQISLETDIAGSQFIQPGIELFDRSGKQLTNNDWKSHLGATWFNLPLDSAEGSYPSFRSLLPMFVRRQESGGFQSPMQHTTRQPILDQRLVISYLIGLDWTIVDKFKQLKSDEKTANDLHKAMKSGRFGHFVSVAELRTSLTVAEERADSLRKQIDTFQVIPEYRELEGEASRITADINSLNVDNIADRELLQELEQTLSTEELPASGDLPKLYKEAGVVLPELTCRRFEDVQRFHERIVENRRSHLTSEIAAAKDRMKQREGRERELNNRRAQIMAILSSGGALDHFTRLREELGRSEAACEELRTRLEDGEKLERARTDNSMLKNRLVQDLRDDIHERRALIREAVLLFEEFSQLLYEQEGRLVIDSTESGPEFEVHIAAERSKGITNMQIFCFDMMLTVLGVKHHRSPGFLIHDSHLFDGVDERQVARALQIGAQYAESSGFQYIVTMNSDAVPEDGFDKDFRTEDHFLDVRLSDATETGGLFGIRFD